MPDDVWQLITNFGLGITVLIIALVTVVRGDWIPRKSHDREMEILVKAHELSSKKYEERIAEIKIECIEWKNIALRTLDAAESSEEVTKIALATERRGR